MQYISRDRGRKYVFGSNQAQTRVFRRLTFTKLLQKWKKKIEELPDFSLGIELLAPQRKSTSSEKGPARFAILTEPKLWKMKKESKDVMKKSCK